MVNFFNWFFTLIRWEVEGNRTFGEYLLGVLTIFVIVLLWKDVAAKIKERKEKKTAEAGEEVAAENE